MAQGNIIQGQASGKLGDTVLMVRNGTQVSRVYTKSGARSGDAASFASRLQRVRFGSASNQWQLYRYVSTRMFRKGRSTNQSDYNYFVKRNVDNLPYFTKLQNADGVCCMMPGQFSEGVLGRIELMSFYYTGVETGRTVLRVYDTINPFGGVFNWTSKLGDLKQRLQKVYSNARKITILLVLTSEVIITESSESFSSQFFSHHPIVIDLYAESIPGENDMNTNAFFASRISDTALSALFSAQADAMANDNSILRIVSTSETQDNMVNSLGVLVFASNDLVSDCYTTMVPAANVQVDKGVYSVWAQYRTDDALQVACDSYGYQSGVMRDEVAADSGVQSAQAVAFAQSLSRFDRSAAKEYARELSLVSNDLAEKVTAALGSTE